MINKQALIDLELDSVLSLVRHHSICSKGKESITESLITDNLDLINERANKIDELIALIKIKGESVNYFVAIDNIFTYKNSASFVGKDIYSVGCFLSAIPSLEAFLSKELIDKDLIELKDNISLSIDEDGLVKETHPLLYPLYKKVEETKQRRQIYSQNFLSSHLDAAQNLNAVYRNERVVLPIKREKRGEVEGYIQGSSQSGGTLFIEPFELVELNNQVVLAEEEIIRMKQKILLDISLKIRSHLETLKYLDEFVTDFDIHYSAACFVIKNKAVRIESSKSIKLINARHPLLGKKAVPITLCLDESTKCVVLSGANAGGKTVSMKTVALFTLLNQIFGFAPCEEGSALPIYSNVYTDIGDGQSISENFSTFSHHMSNVAYITKKADESSLILLDELGSGTDPQEGSALTIALLDSLMKKGSTVFITSHYSTVKMHAYNTDFMMNASMEFDERSSMPTYKIIPGLPGESHAIEIAKRMGVSKEVIAAAKENLGSTANVTKLMNELSGKNRALDRKITQLELEKRELIKREKEAELIKLQNESLEKKLRKEGDIELNKFLNSARKELERLVHDVSTGKLNSEKTKNVKQFIKKLENKANETHERVKSEEEEEINSIEYDFKEGDEVLCGAYSRRGIILKDLGKGRYQVALDNIKMTLTKKELQPAKKEEVKFSSSYKISAVKPSLVMDVRGLTLKETLEKLDTQLEGCLVYNLSSFSIIHGYGDGILSRGIHEYLKKQKDVKDYRFAAPEDGGMGKTYVFF